MEDILAALQTSTYVFTVVHNEGLSFLLYLWSQLILNTDGIEYGGRGLVKEHQYTRKTISKR